MAKVYNIDNNDLNADWIKTRTWDLPTDPEHLARLFGPDWYDTLSRLPAWQAAPPEVKSAWRTPSAGLTQPEQDPFAKWFD